MANAVPLAHAGMPPPDGGPPLSRHEFWPTSLFYLPVWAWIGWLTLRHRGLRLPLLANPAFPAGGLVGESKSLVLELAGETARRWFAPHISFDRSDLPSDADCAAALAKASAAGLALPLVAKPDLGCRGAGVRPVHTAQELSAYLAGFPSGARLVLQQMIDVEGEAGLFWVKEPGAACGRIHSLTLKYFPAVVGDGHATLEQLIHADPRAGQVPHLYLDRNAAQLQRVLAPSERYRLAFAGSHSRGAIFRDGTHLVTAEMEARFEEIAADIPEFWFGRFDIRFADFRALQRGEGFRILEVNGAGAEATHIWDSRIPLRSAYRSLFRQWSLLWSIGARNRDRGFKPEPFADFITRWRREKELTPLYPPTA